MKKWNAPEVAELNITETANGIFDACFETCILFHQHESKKDDTTPDTPDDNSR